MCASFTCWFNNKTPVTSGISPPFGHVSVHLKSGYFDHSGHRALCAYCPSLIRFNQHYSDQKFSTIKIQREGESRTPDYFIRISAFALG